MGFDWSEYFALAQYLESHAATLQFREGALRSAISRAYYGAFCSARNHLRVKEKKTFVDDGWAHSEVPDAFRSESAGRERLRVASTLDRLKKKRAQADYDDTVPGLEGLAVRSIEESKEILAILSGL